jgi:hypothetical protein
MESAFVLAKKPPLEILTQVRNGLPAAMFEQFASALGLSTSTLAAKLGIARRTVTRKRGNEDNGAPLSSETKHKVDFADAAPQCLCAYAVAVPRLPLINFGLCHRIVLRSRQSGDL